jgi:hypothetical protein
VVTAEAEPPEASVVPFELPELSPAPLDSLEPSLAVLDSPVPSLVFVDVPELDLWLAPVLTVARFSVLATSAGSCPEASCT